jgi:SAM-dependent methyltransferase
VDIGCGQQGDFLRHIEPYISQGVGFDMRLPENGIKNGKLTLKYCADLTKEQLPLAANTADYVVLLAVLEHLSEPEIVLREIHRVLKPGGQLLCTVPTWSAKPVLEFLAFKLHIIAYDEIEDHKRYYNKEELKTSLEAVFGKASAKTHYFELGWNVFGRVQKAEESAVQLVE